METASARDQVVEEELSDQEEVLKDFRLFKEKPVKNSKPIHSSTRVTVDHGREKLK